jgi:[protein-PII] uridylyltransferase
MNQPNLPPTVSAADSRAGRLEAARAELRAATERGEGGRVALKQYSQRMDALLQQLFVEASGAAQPVGVFALGGFGRRQLCLHSDIDLLILFAGPLWPEDERFLHAFLNPLWDIGLTIGHHVREVAEGAGLDADNPEFQLALTDARAIAGDATLLDAFFDASSGPVAATRTFEALKTLIADRHARFNDTFYQLEPDVKEAPGGLRDLFGAMTIAKLTDPALFARPGGDPRSLDDAEEFLLRVRSVLHLETKRHHDVLSHELQEGVADRLRYQGDTPRQRVERLMGEYFRHARAVDRALRWTLRTAPLPIGPNLVRSADGIRFVDVREAAARPETWLALFQAAIDQDCGVSDEALACVQQNAGRFTAEEFFPTVATRDALLRFLKPHAGLYARLSEMHDSGLLGQMFPEFKGISCRVVRDFYHKYTVDEHTLLTIRNLERLMDASPERLRFARLLGEIDAPELLVLALLYHDIGKSKDDDHHHLESARQARLMYDRLHLERDAKDTIDFLVSHHLDMSVAAFRRDTEDPEIVRQFAEVVGVEQRLKMLCLMTLADVEAVSRETLTPWKEELLWRLYVDTYNYLTLSYSDEVLDRNQAAIAAVVEGREADLTAKEVEEFLQGLPRRYLQLFSREAVSRHVRLSRGLGRDVLHGWIQKTDAAWELTVITKDKPFLFSNISGVLSSYGMDILRGYAFTKPDGLVVDTFHFTDEERFLDLNPEDGEALIIRRLEEVIAGRADIASRLKGREEGALRQRLPGFSPVVHCDNDSSRRYTIVEIVAENRLGLLYRVSRAMSESGCDVDLVLIATEGRRAIDVFHLTRGGKKLTPAQQQEVTANLHRVLEGRS